MNCTLSIKHASPIELSGLGHLCNMPIMENAFCFFKRPIESKSFTNISSDTTTIILCHSTICNPCFRHQYPTLNNASFNLSRVSCRPHHSNPPKLTHPINRLQIVAPYSSSKPSPKKQWRRSAITLPAPPPPPSAAAAATKSTTAAVLAKSRIGAPTKPPANAPPQHPPSKLCPQNVSPRAARGASHTAALSATTQVQLAMPDCRLGIPQALLSRRQAHRWVHHVCESHHDPFTRRRRTLFPPSLPLIRSHIHELPSAHIRGDRLSLTRAAG